MCRWRVVTVNAGRKAAGPEGIESLMCALATAGMAWDALYVKELDGIRSGHVSSGRTRAGHVWHRHYPGAGSCAMAWVIHRRCTATCTGVRWRGRAGALRLRPTRVHDGSCTQSHTQRHFRRSPQRLDAGGLVGQHRWRHDSVQTTHPTRPRDSGRRHQCRPVAGDLRRSLREKQG